jgi:hypothetical protein
MSGTAPIPAPDTAAPVKDRRALITLTWVWVGAPFAYGLYELFQTVVKLFNG